MSWPFVLSLLFFIHTLSDCLYGFVFPSPIGYREGGTGMTLQLLTCVSHKITGDSQKNGTVENMPEPHLKLSGKFSAYSTVDKNKGSRCHKALSET